VGLLEEKSITCTARVELVLNIGDLIETRNGTEGFHVTAFVLPEILNIRVGMVVIYFFKIPRRLSSMHSGARAALRNETEVN